MSDILEYVKSQKDTRSKIREELVELNKQTIATQAKKLKRQQTLSFIMKL
jgi:hypothetical protein